jgi:hypothetical protein
MGGLNEAFANLYTGLDSKSAGIISSGDSKSFQDKLGEAGKMLSADDSTTSDSPQASSTGQQMAAMANMNAMAASQRKILGYDRGFYGHMTVSKARSGHSVNITGEGNTFSITKEDKAFSHSSNMCGGNNAKKR